jgi:hypothetical protein
VNIVNKKTEENLENKTSEQVKQEILTLVDSGLNYREIAKIPYKVEGKIRKFSISQISKFVKQRNEVSEEVEGFQASKAFQLFEQGKSPIDAVIELKILPENAEEYYKKYLKLKELDLTTPIVPELIKDLQKSLDQAWDTINNSVINPFLGCNNPKCSAKDTNELEVETVCKACGTKDMQLLNWEEKNEE